jgi:hypothetical protein
VQRISDGADVRLFVGGVFVHLSGGVDGM